MDKAGAEGANLEAKFFLHWVRDLLWKQLTKKNSTSAAQFGCAQQQQAAYQVDAFHMGTDNPKTHYCAQKDREEDNG